MTKAQFIELIKGKLTSADPNPDLQDKYHSARIELFISLAMNDVIYQVFSSNLDEKDLYVKTYSVDVQYDDTYKQYFANLPVNVIQLPQNAGIHKISPVEEKWSFVPINQLSEEVFDELEVNTTCEEPSYYYNMDKVFFQFYDWKTCHTKKVRMDIVVPFEDYADTDKVVIPAGKEQQVVELVFQMMSQQIPADDTQNLNDTQT